MPKLALALVVLAGCATAAHVAPAPAPAPLRTRFVPGGGVVGTGDALLLFVAPESRGFVVAEPDQWQRPLPGFAYGIDLRTFTNVALVVDLGPGSCEALAARDVWTPRTQLAAAVEGLGPEARVTLLDGSGAVFTETEAASRPARAALQVRVASLACGTAAGGIAPMLGRALAGAPDVVVAISHFDEELDASPFVGAAPVIAVSLSKGDAHGPLLAAETGGMAVTGAPSSVGSADSRR